MAMKKQDRGKGIAGLCETAAAWKSAGNHFVLVSIASAKGSTPRDEGALMLVDGRESRGSIGGGRLEHLAHEKARQMLGTRETIRETVRLGPEIGQCCGGSAELAFTGDADAALALLEQASRGEHVPHVHIFGAGHTGVALARALTLLPVNVILCDSRPDFPRETVTGVRIVHAALPESLITDAPAGSAFLAMTHDHYLDFAITAQAMARGDAAYVGMIGSATKRAVLASWMRENGFDPAGLERLSCPIGSPSGAQAKVADKRPEVIAALTAGELAQCLFGG